MTARIKSEIVRSILCSHRLHLQWEWERGAQIKGPQTPDQIRKGCNEEPNRIRFLFSDRPHACGAAGPGPSPARMRASGRHCSMDRIWTTGLSRSGATNRARTLPTRFVSKTGVMTVSYDGYTGFDEQFGHIFYREPFSHYRLLVEYRFTGEQALNAPDWAVRNSGAMLHSQHPGTMPADQNFPISIEAQFLGGLGDGNTRSTGNMCSPGTHIVYDGTFTATHCIDSASDTYHGDQWVTAEILVLGNERIVHFINGEQVMEYGGTTIGGGAVSGHLPEAKPDGAPLSEGYISLQSEGHPIQFRRVELLNLKGCMDPQAANFMSHYVEADPSQCE